MTPQRENVRFVVRLADPDEYLTGIYYGYLDGERLNPNGGCGYWGWTGRSVRTRMSEHRSKRLPLDLAWVLSPGTEPQEQELHAMLVKAKEHQLSGKYATDIYHMTGLWWREVLRFQRLHWPMGIILVPRDYSSTGQRGLFDGEPPI
jgi:hypothetical protein